MITKQCQGCGRYFAGQFDGDYTCPECRHGGILRPRGLAPLAAAFDEWAPTPAPRAPHSTSEHGNTGPSARGQAA